jgi:hypothetical protein
MTIPKFDRVFWSETFKIDSVKFFDGEVLFISDVLNGENPQLRLRWVHYPKMDKIQVCFAVNGKFHMEQINYNTKKPHEWKERLWIYIPPEILPCIIAFLEKNPKMVASWV